MAFTVPALINAYLNVLTHETYKEIIVIIRNFVKII